MSVNLLSLTKRIITIILMFLGMVILILAIYVAFITVSYKRVGNTELIIDNNLESPLDKNTLSILSYNIGFGAYSRGFSFFMDGGTNAKAKNIEEVEKNTSGVSKVINDTAADFVLLQELDRNATRSRYVNQYEMIIENLNNEFASLYSLYFDTYYLLFPPNDPIGRNDAGLVTLSKYSINSAYRYELQVSNSWPSYLFDLDRCFSVTRLDYNNRELVIVNNHLTAYDDTGIRTIQLEMLQNFMVEEKDKGNYIILGGDYNHDLINSYGVEPLYQDGTKPEEDWIQILPNSFIDFLSVNDFDFHFGLNEPSCRSSAYAYDSDSKVWTIDGFIVSNNIEVDSCIVIDDTVSAGYENFIYSDHNPVLMKFTLN